jgi:hypothetical protein
MTKHIHQNRCAACSPRRNGRQDGSRAMTNNRVVPFGKYKDRSIAELVADDEYVLLACFQFGGCGSIC